MDNRYNNGLFNGLFKRLGKSVNREIISYVIAGVLTTAVDYIVFIIVNEILKGGGIPVEKTAVIAAAVSWLAAVAFAYVSNKLAVFRNYDFTPGHLLKESASFFAARALSGIISIALIWAMTGPLSWNEYIAKLFTSAFNLVFNYIASKLFIFKKKEKSYD